MTATVVHARLAATVSILALTMATPALAQTAPESGATTVEDIIVTAQKREESIQDVPIAVSAFSAETLDAMKIEGGSELMRAIPNVSFSKNNFSMYNFSIRGIGTKAISASSDPAVAVSFNNTPLIRNRLFEQEYLDVNRVEVLRGPQGTLYGRNATAGVVNMIPNLPGPDFEAMLKAEAGNFGSARGQMMVNIPLTDTFWVRGAASLTKRDGFDHNTYNDTRVNNRDLYSTRLAALWEPSDDLSINLIWEHFGEDDQRSRTGKQLCTRDPGPTRVGNQNIQAGFLQNRLSQGCLPGSLYSDDAYGAPNAGSFAHVFIAGQIELGQKAGADLFDPSVYGVNYKVDPYLGIRQSTNLREISTSYDPVFRASNDVVQLNVKKHLTENVVFHSQTAYTRDSYYSSQDYSRYVSNPIFSDSTQPLQLVGGVLLPTNYTTPNGYYLDPQLGLSNGILSVDLSKSDNEQFTQEFRISSSSGSRFNYSVGANYLNFKSEDNYYVFNNLFNYISEYWYNSNLTDLSTKGLSTLPCDANFPSHRECIYVDRTSLGDLEGDGHNYFRSQNKVKITSAAIFGEGYFDVTPDVRLTVGLRYTDDRKVTTPIPSQLLLGALPGGGPGPSSGGYVSRGYPALPDVKQDWQAATGRLVIDWKPELSFTDKTMIYASYARGYKGGGTNPPRVDINPDIVQYNPLNDVFDSEYVNSFEFGIKNTFLNGRAMLNASSFFYDYEDYQVSQIVDRISLNENFDARIWGVELEGSFYVNDRLRIDATLGYLNTRIGDGEGSIDVMNRTQGNSDWTVLRPWIQVPSNCVAPTEYVERILGMSGAFGESLTAFALQALCGGSARYGSFSPEFASDLPFWAFYGFMYNPLTDAPNYGRGFEADLSGNKLPNSPELTFNIGVQYEFPSIGSYDVIVRGDYYRQSDSYFRVFNTEFDKIKSWGNANLSISINDSVGGLAFEAYVKNVFDNTPIVDGFVNSDDTGLTTNVFTLDPRVYGFSIKKQF